MAGHAVRSTRCGSVFATPGAPCGGVVAAVAAGTSVIRVHHLVINKSETKVGLGDAYWYGYCLNMVLLLLVPGDTSPFGAQPSSISSVLAVLAVLACNINALRCNGTAKAAVSDVSRGLGPDGNRRLGAGVGIITFPAAAAARGARARRRGPGARGRGRTICDRDRRCAPAWRARPWRSAMAGPRRPGSVARRAPV